MKLRKNDVVMVISGTQRGKTGKILEVDRAAGRVLVEGVNFIWKHLRRSQQHPHGARIQKEAPVHASNVMLVCPSCSKPSKIGLKRLEDGERARICKKCRQAVASEA